MCLYSEGAKFFLHGALYCELASAIASEKSLGDIARSLGRNFSASDIDEAVGRLLDRGFILPGTAAGDAAAGYWASLGLPSDRVVANLGTLSVKIQAIGGGGAIELDAALRELGVRVADRSAELIVVLVNDYLDGRLSDYNNDQLAHGQRWCLVQLSGIFPLVGPIFIPGKSACWRCLADRMKQNRQIKAFLDRNEARCLAISPLDTNIFCQTPVGLTAIEIAKAIASGFRTDLHENPLSLNLLGSTIMKHYVAARPQCPSCGRSEQRDPERTPVPIRLRAGGSLVVTSEGYRAVTPSATLAAYRKHVSPLTGVVSHLERIGSDLPANASYLAMHNFSPRPESVDALKIGLTRSSYGKGTTADQGEVSALMEAIERYSGIFQGDQIRRTSRFVDFPPGEAIHPNDVMLFSDIQYQRDAIPVLRTRDRLKALRPFDCSAAIEWSPVWSLRDERFKYLPTGVLYYLYNGDGHDQMSAESNGCAAGNTLEEAILQGFLELVERDACAIWWYNRLRPARVDLDQFGDSYISGLRRHFVAAGWNLGARHHQRLKDSGRGRCVPLAGSIRRAH